MPTSPHISPVDLTRFTAGLFRAYDVTAFEAQAVAECLVENNLRGHDSHGIVQICGYLKQLKKGELVAGAAFESLCETDSLLVADAHYGFGFVQCARLVDALEPKARAQGVACGTLRNSGHVGRLGTWAERVAARGLAGLVTSNDNGILQCVAPPGGTVPRISTNPFAIAVPTGGDLLALDISTSIVANGKVLLDYLAGRDCPPGWLQDASGAPTTDPAVRFTDPRGTLLPMGGEQGYKGFGLALLLDILVGGLSGGLCPPGTADALNVNNVLLIVWDPDRFAGHAHFTEQADRLIDYVRASPLKAGVELIRLPGDRANALFEERSRLGIPIDEKTWQALVKLADERNVSVPPLGVEES